MWQVAVQTKLLGMLFKVKWKEFDGVNALEIKNWKSECYPHFSKP